MLCRHCEEYVPMDEHGESGTCSAAEARLAGLRFPIRDVVVRGDTDASQCWAYSSDCERESANKAKSYGLRAGVDFPGSLGRKVA